MPMRLLVQWAGRGEMGARSTKFQDQEGGDLLFEGSVSDLVLILFVEREGFDVVVGFVDIICAAACFDAFGILVAGVQVLVG